MRVVLDTDVVVAAFRSDLGASRQLLVNALDGRVVTLCSVPLMLEYEAVLKRPEHLAETGLDAFEIDEILDALAAVIQPVRFAFLWRPSLKDTSDEMVLETAANGGADHLVSFNVRHLRDAAQRFGIRVVSPGEVWRELRSHADEKK